MAREILLPDEHPTVHRRSSIDQYRNFLSVMKKGGWAPIVFDQLDGITCETVKHHPIIISFGNDVGYHFKDGECSYTSDKFVYFDKAGVEQRLLPECMGGKGEFYELYVKGSSFLNFDVDSSLGSHNIKRLRTGLDYVISDEILQPEA